jgi:hypothetical protein
VSRNIDIIFIIIVLFIYIIKTLVTYQVTNDHGLICLHKLNTSIVQTRLVSVRTTQKWLHISTCTPLTQRLQPHPVGWTKTRLTTSCWMDQDTTNHILLDRPRHDYVTCRTQMNPLSPFIFQMEV